MSEYFIFVPWWQRQGCKGCVFCHPRHFCCFFVLFCWVCGGCRGMFCFVLWGVVFGVIGSCVWCHGKFWRMLWEICPILWDVWRAVVELALVAVGGVSCLVKKCAGMWKKVFVGECGTRKSVCFVGGGLLEVFGCALVFFAIFTPAITDFTHQLNGFSPILQRLKN